MEIEHFYCERGDQTSCYKLHLWVAYVRDEGSIAYGYSRDIISTSYEFIQTITTSLSENDELDVWYDPLLDGVFSIDYVWTNTCKLGLLASGLAFFGWSVLSGFLIYYQVWPWFRDLFLRKKEDFNVELMKI